MKLLILYLSVFGAFAFASAESCEGLQDVKVEKYSDFSSNFELVPFKSENLKNAQKIVFNKQNIKSLCVNSITNLNAETIEFSDCTINKIESGAFGKLKYLNNLQFKNCGLKNVPKGVFSGLSLRKLNLSSNAITSIEPDAFNNMPRLEVLDLSHNKIGKVDEKWLEGSDKVNWIILDYNLLDELPKSGFKSPISGSKLDLWLAGNKIKTIHSKVFERSKNLGFVMLENNLISDIDEKVFKDVQVSSLFLNGNRIECLNDNVVRSMRKVSTVFLSKNPIECDCLKKMKIVAKSMGIDLNVLTRSVECLQDKLKGIKKMYSIDKEV